MDLLHSSHSIGISDLRLAPARAFEQSMESPVVVLSHNKPAGYLVSPAWMERVLDQLADQEITRVSRIRLSDMAKNPSKSKRVSINDLGADFNFHDKA